MRLAYGFPYYTLPGWLGNSEDKPLRYRYNEFGAENEADKGFELLFTFDLRDKAEEDFYPEGCVAPYALVYNTSDWNKDDGGNKHYEKIQEITLSDDRTLGLWEKKSDSCREIANNNEAMNLLLEKLRNIESY
jgi:hypothetical protein